MSCQLCQPAYESGKRNGERDGRMTVVRELLAFADASTGKASGLLVDGKVDDAKRFAAGARAVFEFAQDLLARTQKEFG